MNQEVIHIKLKDVVYSIRKHRSFIIICTIIGFALGILLGIGKYLMSENEKNYEISASVAITAQTESGFYTGQSGAPSYQDVYLAANMADSVMYVCKSDTVLNQVISKLRLLGVIPDNIRKAFTLTQYNETQIVEMKLSWQDDREGIAILETLIEMMPGVLIETLKIGNVTVVDKPTAAESTAGSFKPLYVLILAFTGMCTGIGHSFASLYIHPTLIDTDEVFTKFGLNTFGEIPRERFYQNKAGQTERQSQTFQESYASAAHILMHQLEQKEHQSVFITSSLQGEGKSSVAANLGVQLSRLGKRVLLIDFDLRKPSLGGFFLEETDHDHSLNGIYYGRNRPEQAVVHINENLDLLPTRLENKRIALDSFVMETAKTLGLQYDLVLMDTAPVGQVADTMSLNQIADSALYVIGFDKVWCEVIKNDIRRLQQSGIPILGCIINGVEPDSVSEMHYYHHGYGNNQDKKEEILQMKQSRLSRIRETSRLFKKHRKS